MIASRRYCIEPDVDTIGEIEDTNDEKDVDARQLAESLNKVINVLAVQTDRINFQHSETKEEESKSNSEPKQPPSDDLISVDSISSDSIEPPQTVAVDVHHADIGHNRQLKDHIDVKYEGVVVSRFNLTQANVMKINQLLSTYSSEENNNEEPGTKTTSIMKNIPTNNQTDMIYKSADKTVKKHKRNVNFTSQAMVKTFQEQGSDFYEAVEPIDFKPLKGSPVCTPNPLAHYGATNSPRLAQDKQDVETQTDQGKEGCGMM